RELRTVGESYALRGSIERNRAYAEEGFDVVGGIEVTPPKWDPFLGCVACQVVLREVRPIDGPRLVGADQGYRAPIAPKAQLLGRASTRRPGPHDHDGLGGCRNLHRQTLALGLSGNEEAIAARLDLPAGDRVQRRCAGPTVLYAELRVVPRAAHV